MKKPLRLLLVEDSDLDAAHLLLELRRGGFDPQVKRVELRDDFANALMSETWDAIISDYHLPRFSAPEALAVYRATGLDIPFIVVSGAIGEETAVELMRAGAHDYLLKHRLTRLAAAIDRELQQADDRRAKRRAENLFQAVLRASPLPAVIIDRATMRIVDGSDSFRRQFGADSAITPMTELFEIVPFSQPERIEQLLARGSGTAWSTVYHLGGVARVANVRCHTVEYEGASYAYVVLEDVTDANYLKAAFDAVPDPLLIVSSQQQLLYANRPAEELFGSLYFGADVTPLLARPALGERWWQKPTNKFEEQRIEINEQPYDAGSVPFRLPGENLTSTILTLRNVSAEEELIRLATHDALTGIYNTRYFQSSLDEHLRDGGGALALIDLDYFKPINDEMGHAAGDAALITFAHLVRSELRPADVFARLGGDEFAVFFPRTSVDGAVAVMESLYRRLARSPFRYDGATRALSVSSGVAGVADGEDADGLKRRADAALYEAKRQGRGRWVVA